MLADLGFSRSDKYFNTPDNYGALSGSLRAIVFTRTEDIYLHAFDISGSYLVALYLSVGKGTLIFHPHIPTSIDMFGLS